MTNADVLVLGAGPAGTTIAYHLARSGLNVQVVDRESGPTFRVGESLLPEGIRICREMGLSEQLAAGPFLDKHGAQFILSEDGASDRFAFAEALRAERCDQAYQVKRLDFDAMLQNNAEAAGASIRWDFAAREVNLDCQGGVAVSSSDGESLRARYLVDATGQAHLLAKKLGLRQPIAKLRKVAVFSHFKGIPQQPGKRRGDITIMWNRDGWFWVIPFADGTASVGAVADPELIQQAGANDQDRFDGLCEQSEVHRQHFADREQLGPLQRHADYSFQCAAKTGDRFVLLGDASGFIDPIFSTGVFLAQSSACLAADMITPALTTGTLPSLEQRSAFEDKVNLGLQRYGSLVRQFYNAEFMDNVIRARRREQTRRALTSVLAGDIYDDENPLLRMGVFD